MGDSLGIKEEQTEFTQQQIQSLAKETGIPVDAGHVWQKFFHLCKQSGLDPWARQIYATIRDGKVSFQSTIDGFRLTARRACQRTGEALSELGVYWYNQDGKEYTEWVFPHPPAAAKYVVQRGVGQFSGFARFEEYAGKNRQGGLSYMWGKMPALMIAKCAEALALRKAFPQDLSGIYTDDEMAQAAPVEPIPTLEQRKQPNQEAQAPTPETQGSSLEPVEFTLPPMPEQGTEEDREMQISLVIDHARIMNLTPEQVQSGALNVTKPNSPDGQWDTWPTRTIEAIWRAMHKVATEKGLIIGE